MSNPDTDHVNIHINRPDVRLADDDVSRVLDALRKQTAAWEQHKGPARIGDKALIEYTITSNGRVIADTFGNPAEHELLSNPGPDDFLSAKLPGLRCGERFEFTVRRTKRRESDSRRPAPGKYSVHIAGIMRRNEQKSRQALAALFGRKTIRPDTLLREIRETMLARLDILIRRDVKHQLFNALYARIADNAGSQHPDKTVDHAQYRATVADQIRDFIQENDVNLDYSRVENIISALASRAEDPESIEKKYQDDIELQFRVEAAVLEDQIVELMLDRASVESTPVQYQAFIPAATNSTPHNPGNESHRSSIIEISSATKCGYCSNSKCCQYITQKISAPRSKSDFSFLLWQVSHENITIFKDDDGWNLMVRTRCTHLQPEGQCGIYESRPEICRSYKNDYCEFEGPAEEGYELCFHDYPELLEYCQKRFKRWNEYLASQ